MSASARSGPRHGRATISSQGPRSPRAVKSTAAPPRLPVYATPQLTATPNATQGPLSLSLPLGLRAGVLVVPIGHQFVRPEMQRRRYRDQRRQPALIAASP
jgi:hypothetical protein